MEWAKPIYSKKEINWAGAYLLDDASRKELRKVAHAIDIVDNFRASHAFPLNTLQYRLRKLSYKVERKSIVAQRLKRFVSIMNKLTRFQRMKLYDMQDIGGCRAVVHDLKDVERLVDAFHASHIKHKLTHYDDYIKNPKNDGYRSWHLVYRYMSDKKETYNGLKVEIQIRTPLQHSWATTVETVDLFTRQALKSSRGMPEWRRFFQLMGTEIALLEDTPLVPGTPSDINILHKELSECEKELSVIASLTGFTNALSISRRVFSKMRGDYFLLSLNNVSEELSITSYKRSELEEASKAYALEERQVRKNKGTDAVLVSVDSIRDLKRAYPNYFADTRLFVEILKRAIKNKKGLVDPRQLRLFK